ncbi:MAG TPA: mannitol dehydrogenase family protein [Steroidobacteraceae bacterium]|nr:mannitol dehydrogenase family protein [Steroidobacteraceae bacterium]
MTSRLNLKTLAALPPEVGRPDYDFLKTRIGIVHLGLGAFHRAHQAVYTEDALRSHGGDWGVLGASLRHAAVPGALADQQQLYTVESLGNISSYRVVAAVRTSLTGTMQRMQLLSALSSPQTHIVTLTVTEKGYCLAMNGGLDVANAEIAHDLGAPSEPSSSIGWLAAGLVQRYESHRRPLTIISCDNLQSNGAKLARAMHEFVERSRPEMLAWMRDNVRYPQTVVDCIVPAATDESRARVRQALGVDDLACVQREPYSQWIIEDRFAGPRPAWEHGGALIVADVIDYGRLKLHVLNTCHSALAYLGLPRRYTFVREAMADPELAQFLETLVSTEIAPALAPLEVQSYWQTVRPRFANPRIDHRLAQIAQDGALKLAERVFPLMISNARAGAPVHALARIVRGCLELTGVGLDAALQDGAMLPPAIRTNSSLRAAISAAIT